MSARGPELVTLPAGMDPGCDGQAGEECLKDAPTNRRMAFVLRGVQELSTEEIRKSSGHPEGWEVVQADALPPNVYLNWRKRYITLGPVATVIGLAFRLRDPNRLFGGQEDLGITCALIPADLPGIDIGKRHNPMGVPIQNG